MPRIWKLWRDRRRDESDEQQDARLAEARAALALDYRQTFATDHGQRVLADILRRAGMMQDTYDAHPPNAAYNQGKQRVGLEIIEMINANPADQLRLAQSGETEDLFA